jgi:hypothetical protein
MSPETARRGLGIVALVAYAVLGGADFGGGIWDLFATGPRREAQREAIAHAMGPVWEANHVWLIFVIVIIFSAFPRRVRAAEHRAVRAVPPGPARHHPARRRVRVPRILARRARAPRDAVGGAQAGPPLGRGVRHRECDHARPARHVPRRVCPAAPVRTADSAVAGAPAWLRPCRCSSVHSRSRSVRTSPPCSSPTRRAAPARGLPLARAARRHRVVVLSAVGAAAGTLAGAAPVGGFDRRARHPSC